LLCVALPAFGASLLLAFAGSSSFGSMQLFLGQVLAKIGMMLCVFALVFHWCHGVRHLFMDIGKTLDKETMPRYVMLEIAISAMLTAVAALIILAE
jgi:succinate dehydrogenase / fumarate reductase cytochrome b subunit